MMEKPVARKEDLVIQNVDGELLVYDLRTNKAYHLTETAAFVWKACDGEHTAEDIRQKLEERFNSKVNEEFVNLALEQLGENNLLEGKLQYSSVLSRREVLKRIGVASMIALPVVASLTIPNTALAVGTCPTCSNPAQCAGSPCGPNCNPNPAPGNPPICGL